MKRSWQINGLLCASLTIALGANAEEPSKTTTLAESATTVSGREIFLREWLPNDPRSHGGDGLGPVFNETSCVSCHNQGGIGGGGAEAKNVIVISAARVNPMAFGSVSLPGQGNEEAPEDSPVAIAAREPETLVRLNGISPAIPTKIPRTPEEKQQERERLIKELKSIHPGLISARSIVLHKFGTDPKYAEFRDKATAQNGFFQTVSMSPVEPVQVAEGQLVVAPSSERSVLETAQENRPGHVTIDDVVQKVSHATELLIHQFQPPSDLLMEKQRAMVRRFGGMSFGFAVEAPPTGPDSEQDSNESVPSNQRTLTPVTAERNSIALFGIGLIDSIPSDVIEANAKKPSEQFPEISGRVARLKDGRIGRFGWKAQKATLYDFTMTACAVELGLNVPDHPQAGNPMQSEYQPTGFDLNQDECKQLVQFLRDLPAPSRSGTTIPAIAKTFEAGQAAFEKVGCAACHSPNLGDVKGIYSDLLVHDMGPELGDSGSYGVFQPSMSDDSDDLIAGLMPTEVQQPIFPGPVNLIAATMAQEKIPAKMVGAVRQEWRTPPLWGVRDSAPYLHDGRAATLEQAIAMHGGEAQLTANRFFQLSPEERSQVLAFLRSMVAPN